MKTKWIFLSMLSMWILTACSNDIAEEQKEAVKIRVSIADLINGDEVGRVAIDLTSNPKFPFTENDTLGIFPSVGDQVSFPLSGSVGQTTTSFDGGGWRLKDSETYYAYMPFSRKNFVSYDQKNQLSVNYLGQEQDGVNNTNNIGNYVYMTSEGLQPVNGGISFQLNHVGALARIGITFPAAATYTKIFILAESEVFATTGTLDLESNSVAILPVTKSNKMAISLKNIVITSSNISSSYNFYMMFPPCNCTDQALEIVLVDSKGCLYSAHTRVGMKKNFEAGHYYGFTTTESFVKTESNDIAPTNVNAPSFQNITW